MAADWAALTRFLSGQGQSVTLTWRELEEIVGGMPASSIDHSAWWNGDRPHTRAWKAAGFQLAEKTPGVSVLFMRVGSAPPTQPPRTRTVLVDSPAAAAPGGRAILVSCAKQKAHEPMAAKDLYKSSRFRKARAYAEERGKPWFILSAAHGLVAPEDWLAPYDLYLGDTSSSYRQAWGAWVVARLEMVLGGLSGLVVEVHAGSDYVSPIRQGLETRGARVELPLEGLGSGETLAWYDRPTVSVSEPWLFTGDTEKWIEGLGSIDRATAATEMSAANVPARPGLYSWFVDVAGAIDLSRGLGHEIAPGLVYVGQTGATKWPTGITSAATLQSRIRRQHLAGRRTDSTLRRTFGAILDSAYGRPVERRELTSWMAAHLSVAFRAADDADSLGDLERQVVQALDPPLNLDHTSPTPVRVALRKLRRNKIESPD